MSIISNNITNVNTLGKLSPVDEDRATLGNDLSAYTGPPFGDSLPIFMYPYLEGGNECAKPYHVNLEGDRLGSETLDVPSSSLITSLDNSKHIGIFENNVKNDNEKFNEFLFAPEISIRPSAPVPKEKHIVNTAWQANNESLKHEREKIANILLDAGRYDEQSKVRYCGEDVIAYKADCCGDTVAYPMSCGHRLCPVCMKRRSARLSVKVMNFIQGAWFLVPVKGEKGKRTRQFIKMKHPVFITLTYANVSAIDKLFFSLLRGCLTKLRHRDIFAECVGGFYGIETTYNYPTMSWHVHIHMIADTPYIPQDKLSEAWHDITGNSYVVDIRKVKNAEKAAKEIAKYIVKPGKFLQDAKLVDEFLNAVKGARLVTTFGKYHNIQFEDEDDCGLPDCLCGSNEWRRIPDFFSLGSIYKDIEGRYRLKAIILDG